MEVGHRVGIVAIHCQAIADVNVAIVPEVGVGFPGTVDDVAVEGETNRSERFRDTVDHVLGRVARAVAIGKAAEGYRRGFLWRGYHARREAIEVIEGVLYGNITQAEVYLVLVVRRLIRVGIVWVHVGFAVAREDGHASEGDANNADDVALVDIESSWRRIVSGPLPVANLAVESSLGVDVHCVGVEEGRVEEDLHVEIILAWCLGRVEAVRGKGVRLHANIGQAIFHSADSAKSADEAAGRILGWARILKAALFANKACSDCPRLGWAALSTLSTGDSGTLHDADVLARVEVLACSLELSRERLAVGEAAGGDQGIALVGASRGAAGALPSLLHLAVAVTAIAVLLVAIVAFIGTEVESIATYLSAD